MLLLFLVASLNFIQADEAQMEVPMHASLGDSLRLGPCQVNKEVNEIYWMMITNGTGNGVIFKDEKKEGFEWNYIGGTDENKKCPPVYLKITKMKKEYFFPTFFICYFSTPSSDDKGEPMKVTIHEIKKDHAPLAIALGIFFTLLLASTICFIYRVEILLFAKDRFGRLETEGEYDLFICYNSEDRGKFVASFLLPYLETELHYKCFVWERNSDCGEWLPDVMFSKIQSSKRFMLVMTSNVVKDKMCIFACEKAIEQAIWRNNLKLISVIPRKDKKRILNSMREVEALHLMRRSSRRVLSVEPEERDKKKQEKFWKQIRLHLPPMRNSVAVAEVV